MGIAVSRHRCRFLPLYIVIILFVIGIVYRFSLYQTYSTPIITRIIHFKDLPSTKRDSSSSLSTEAACVREVLETLKLPFSRQDYSLRSFEHPLELTRLSPSCQTFLIPQTVSDKRRKQLSCFLPDPWHRTFRPLDKERIQGGLLLIRDAFERAYIPISMDGGTALGSWRMHGQIPYDPDVDFLVLMRYKKRAIAVMKQLNETHPHLFNTYENGNNFWRLDLKRKDGSRLFQIDVFIHKLRDHDQIIEQFQPPPKIKARTLLPFIQRPFEGMLFKTWKNMKQYFRQIYGKGSDKICKPTPWIRAHFKLKCRTLVVNCTELNYFFNFAKRLEYTDGKLVEVLFNRSHALGVFYSPEGV